MAINTRGSTSTSLSYSCLIRNALVRYYRNDPPLLEDSSSSSSSGGSVLSSSSSEEEEVGNIVPWAPGLGLPAHPTRAAHAVEEQQLFATIEHQRAFSITYNNHRVYLQGEPEEYAASVDTALQEAAESGTYGPTLTFEQEELRRALALGESHSTVRARLEVDERLSPQARAQLEENGTAVDDTIHEELINGEEHLSSPEAAARAAEIQTEVQGEGASPIYEAILAVIHFIWP